jgi:hypothetical protein
VRTPRAQPAMTVATAAAPNPSRPLRDTVTDPSSQGPASRRRQAQL